MDKKSGSNNSADELRSQINRSRDRLARDFRGLRAELDFPAKIRRSFEQRATWLIGAAVVGTLVVLPLLRKKKVYVQTGGRAPRMTETKGKLLETGFLLGALKIGVTLFRPMIANYIMKKFRAYEGGPAPRKW